MSNSDWYRVKLKSRSTFRYQSVHKNAVTTHTLPPPASKWSCTDGYVSSNTRTDQTATRDQGMMQLQSPEAHWKRRVDR